MFGFNEWDDASNYYLQPQLNMPVRRMLMGWNVVQPTPDTWDWSQSDTAYAQMRAKGLEPLIIIQAAPCWANAGIDCRASQGAGFPPDPAHDGAWSDFISRLAQRYPAAVAIEIWNEENIQPEWLPYPDPARYAQILELAHRAIKRVNPNMPVIAGGLFQSPVSGPYGIADAQFVAGMYAAGVKGSMDGIGIHPYPVAGGWDGTPVRVDTNVMEQTLNRVRAARDAAGDSSTSLWITEMGVSTQSPPGSPPASTPLEQADDLLKLVETVKADPDIRVALIHRLIDQTVWPGDTDGGYDGYGVFNPDGTPKLAACALSRELGGALHC